MINLKYKPKDRPPKPLGTKGDLVGRRHSHLTVLSQVKNAEDTWVVICDCGTQQAMTRKEFFQKRNCGCWKAKMTTVKKVHGKLAFDTSKLLDIHQHRVYNIWLGIWARCTNPKNYMYACYGGRGIKVCKRWRSFENFCKDMGPRPSRAYSTERLDVNGDYEPSNCVWLLKTLQPRNTRKTVRVIFGGVEISRTELLEKFPYLKLKNYPRELVHKKDVTEKVLKDLATYKITQEYYASQQRKEPQ